MDDPALLNRGESSHVGKAEVASCLLGFPDIELWSYSTIAILDKKILNC